jgi:hypothetical protein
MSKELQDLEKVVEHLKEGRLNELESGKFLSKEEVKRVRSRLEDAEREREELLEENQRIKAEADKVKQYQSAYMSN